MTNFLPERAVCAALATAPAVVLFQKRDGSTRRLWAVPPPDGTRERTAADGSRFVQVWDAERGALRQVNASRTLALRTLRARRHETARRTAEEHIRDIFG